MTEPLGSWAAGSVPGARVVFGGGNNATNVTYKSTTTLTATAPAHSGGVVNMFVLTSAGTSPASQNDLYTYTASSSPAAAAPASHNTKRAGRARMTGRAPLAAK